MEAERQSISQPRQEAKRNTAKRIADKRSQAAADARESDSNLMAVYDMFLPGAGNKGAPKYVTDKYGNRILTVQTKKK